MAFQLWLLPRAAYARAGLSNPFRPSVVVVVCHKEYCKILQTGDLEAITIAQGTIENPPKIDVCVPDSDPNVCPALSYSTPVRSAIFNTVENRLRQGPGICGLLTRDHAGVYVR